jgi:8-oxo-dGTP pyrophosphatase MutT (NUDIX family)
MSPVDVSPKVMTLLIVVQGQRVLLGEKKRGFGAGFWNGFGGKVDAGESVDEAALRELREEAGIEAVDTTRRGLLTFVYDDQSRPMEVHVYHASRFTGVPVETEEMRPKWWDVEDLPFERMWPDDEIWYPLFLSDRRFAGTVHFTNTTTIVKHDVREVAAETLAEMVRERDAARQS